MKTRRARHRWELARKCDSSKIEDPLMRCIRCTKYALESEVKAGNLGQCGSDVELI